MCFPVMLTCIAIMMRTLNETDVAYNTMLSLTSVQLVRILLTIIVRSRTGTLPINGRDSDIEAINIRVHNVSFKESALGPCQLSEMDRSKHLVIEEHEIYPVIFNYTQLIGTMRLCLSVTSPVPGVCFQFWRDSFVLSSELSERFDTSSCFYSSFVFVTRSTKSGTCLVINAVNLPVQENNINDVTAAFLLLEIVIARCFLWLMLIKVTTNKCSLVSLVAVELITEISSVSGVLPLTWKYFICECCYFVVIATVLLSLIDNLMAQIVCQFDDDGSCKEGEIHRNNATHIIRVIFGCDEHDDIDDIDDDFILSGLKYMRSVFIDCLPSTAPA